ncbi:hypothetical protein [Nocardioides montaniterrae]
MAEALAMAKDLELVVHIGLHKTASTYVQSVLSAHRLELLQQGLVYPINGTPQMQVRTREGARSGHALLTFRKGRQEVLEQVLREVPRDATKVLVSAEDFTHPRRDPEEMFSTFAAFGRVRVVVTLRRQDDWIESYYKQRVDQFHSAESRSIGGFLEDEGPWLLDLHRRLSPWRDLAGADAFHVLSYDDLPCADAQVAALLAIAGVEVELPPIDVPRYDSARAIDTIGMRLLNGIGLTDRTIRNTAAQEVYAASPEGDLALLDTAQREAIRAHCAPINERIEREWAAGPLPGFRFGRPDRPAPQPPTAEAMAAYVDRVLTICDAARRRAASA